MSILIKMAMPANNEAIVITADGKASKIYGGTIAVMGGYATENSTAVELPPHGRLVDGSDLYAELKKVKDSGVKLTWTKAVLAMANAPTIVEAEET